MVLPNRGRPVDEHRGRAQFVFSAEREDSREGMEGGFVYASSKTAVLACAFYRWCVIQFLRPSWFPIE